MVSCGWMLGVQWAECRMWRAEGEISEAPWSRARGEPFRARALWQQLQGACAEPDPYRI